MNAAARLVEVRVPDMGNFKDVAIIDVLVKPGETIEPEAPLVTLETEKATMDVPSTVGGVIEKIHVAKGGTVSPGDLVVTVRSEGDPGNDAAAAGAASSPSATGPGANNGSPPSAQAGATQPAQGQAAPSQSTAAAQGAGAAGQGVGAAGQGAGAASQGAGAAGQGAGAASQGAGAAGQGAGAAGQGAGAAGQGANAAGQSANAQGGAGQGAAAGSGPQGQPSTGQAGAAQGATPARSGAGQPTASLAASAPSAPGQASATAGAAESTPTKTTAVGANAGTAVGSGSANAGVAGQQGSGPGGSSASAQPAEPLRTDLPPINEPGFSRAHAGPSVRRFARELGVDLTLVKGGGFKGRVTHDDVKGFVKSYLAAKSAPTQTPTPTPTQTPPAAVPARSASASGAQPQPSGLPKVPAIDFAQFGPIETKPLTRIQRISGPRLHASWVNIPHVTQFDEADITDLEDLRAKLKQKAAEQGIKLTPLAFIVRACVRALQEFPLFNTSLDATGASLVFKKYLNIGFAADTPNGLVVPVVRDAGHKDIYEIARNLSELSEKARIGKVSAAEMSGGCFTISSLGGIGGTAFTPIINAPEVAILGVSRSALRPVFRDGAFVPRLLLPLSLSYDHRVIDGALAARFTTFLGQTLADPRGLMEAVL